MADPISIAAAAVGTIQACAELLNFLNETRKGVSSIEQDLKELSEKVLRVQEIAQIINGTFHDEFSSSLASSKEIEERQIRALWRNVGDYLRDCTSIVSELKQLVASVFNPKLSTKDGRSQSFTDVNPAAGHNSVQDSPAIPPWYSGGRLKLYLRKRGLETQFERVDRRLDAAWKSADLLLSAVNLATSRRAQRKTDDSLGDLSSNLLTIGDKLERQMETLRREFEDIGIDAVTKTLAAASSVKPLASINQHFEPPRNVDSNFTGRSEFLSELRDYFFGQDSASQPEVQRRFCIYGLGGSGKTEFCCKFAQENQSKLWGVFWIDASTPLHVQHGYAEIAKLGEKDPNERAAKAWLALRTEPWLLIIDNAAHDADLEELQRYMPGGSSGIILITTRNPVHRTLGNVGCRYFHFKELIQEDANTLLLRTAAEPMPWTKISHQFATLIVSSLGCLPLPLRHAGITILRGLATLGNYLTYYEDQWQRVRASRASILIDEDDHMKAYATYEIIYSGLESKKTTQAQDALDLLKTFSFLYWNNISEKMIFAAVANPKIERDHQANSIQQPEPRGRDKYKNLIEQLRRIPTLLYALLHNVGAESMLPPVLRFSTNFRKGFDEHRLRAALGQLTQLSLVFFNRETGCYSMHPLVHEWVRERPGMSTAEQAIYCSVAATLMAQCVLLPPLGRDEAAEQFRREIHPHIDQVQKFKRQIENALEANRQRRSFLKAPIPVPETSMNRATAIQFVKFSLVYFQSGRWIEARELQESVRGFVLRFLGPKHTSTIDITLFLSSTLWQLGQGDAAADLQATVLGICRSSRGPLDAKSLKVMDALGVSRWLQGKFSAALNLHEDAVRGLEQTQGSGHPDTLIAQGNLGRALAKQCRYDEAIEAHSKAETGLQGVYGDSHLETLIAMDNLAMTYLDRYAYANGPPSDLDIAHRLELHVMKKRKEKLGPEHAYTLWAICNLARIKSAQGQVAEAEKMMTGGISIAEINLGPDHIGTLFGKLYLGNTLIAAHKYTQAEKILHEVIAGHQTLSRPNHPDALLAMSFLLRCHQLNDCADKADLVREQLVIGLVAIGAQDHPWREQLLNPTMEGFGMHAVPVSGQVGGAVVGPDEKEGNVPRALNRSSTV